MFRIYCDGHEFGVDYPSIEAARRTVAAYRRFFPHLRYYIRAARSPRLSQIIGV